MAWTSIYTADRNSIGGNDVSGITDAQKGNVTMLWNYLGARGWTKNAVAGLAGNAQYESYLNPGQWERYENPSYGYGLVQWTPATNYLDWVQSIGGSKLSGDYQLKWINERTVPTGQWIVKSGYPLTFEEYQQSTEEPAYLAEVFFWNFERGTASTVGTRKATATYWFNFLSDEPTPTRSSKMPLFMMLRNKNTYNRRY